MLDVFYNLLPDMLSGWQVLLLVITAAFTSFITAAVGVGGGVLLLAVLSLVIPVSAIIPVHGLVQLGSNAYRSVLLWRNIDWQTVLYFLPGSIVGAALAAVFLIELPLAALQIAIASFILFLCWGPRLPGRVLSNWGVFLAAAITTFLSHFVGATGPLVAAFIKQKFADSRHVSVASFAVTMTIQHGPKALVYGVAGFAFKEWLLLVALMISAGALGTKLGLLQLNKLSDQRFTLVFNTVLTVLALRLLWQAFT